MFIFIILTLKSFKNIWIAISIDKKIVIVGNKIGKHPIQGLISNDSLITESIRDQIILDIELAKHRLAKKTI